MNYKKTKVLLHYGLQRSGTNYVESLLRKPYAIKFKNNKHNRSSALHKHVRLYAEKTIIPEPKYHNDLVIPDLKKFEEAIGFHPDHFLIISKDPYSWFSSYSTWAKKCNWPKPKHHYIEEYNLFYQKFISLSSGSNRFTFLRYCDFITDDQKELKKLEEKLGLKKRLFSRLLNRKPLTKVAHSGHFSEERRRYYANCEFLQELDQQTIETINSKLQLDVLNELGYQLHDGSKTT